MTTPSLLRTCGITLSAWAPDVDIVTPSYTPRGSLVADDLAGRIISYQHTISANGGWDSASIAMALPMRETEDWFSRGLNRHIEAYSPALRTIWAGFVNTVTITEGPLSVIVGPLTDISNRCEVVYSVVDTSTSPPTVGVRTRTATVDDTASQARYGIIHKVLSVGGTTPTDAEQIRDTWLADKAEPTTSHQFGSGGMAQTVVALECLGYMHRLKFYPYNQTTLTGTVDLDAKIQAVLAADPNGLFSTDYGHIASNTLQVKQWEDTDSTAFAVVQALTAMGDAASNRYLFGIYDDQRAYYGQVPTDMEYQASILTDEITTLSQATVRSWDLEPGRWLMYTDFMANRYPSGMLPSHTDPRFEFIESVTYMAPESVQHYGGKVATLPQMLARLGLGGAAS